MFSDYTTMLSWLYQQPLGKSYEDLSHIEQVLHDLGDPHKSVPIIHVTGTNGKGSTIAYLSHILRAHNKNVATFTSPHIHHFNERFQLNHHPVSQDALVSYMQRLQQYGLTQFELFTCAFFLFIADKKPDVAIVEVGIGGLLDTTNVVDPDISVITSIGLDHVPMLGDTIIDIAYQKAGIIKPFKPVVIGDIAQTCLNIIDDTAQQRQSSVYKYQDFSVNAHKIDQTGIVFEYEGEQFESQLLGAHQIHNASLALKTAQLFLKETWSIIQAQTGVSKTVWLGRMERVYDKPVVYLDGAHNEQGIVALNNTLKQIFDNKPVNILFGALSRKDYKQMVTLLQDVSDIVHVTPFNHPQSITKTDVQESDAVVIVDDWQKWVSEYIQKSENSPLIVTGSLYFISEVRSYFIDCMDKTMRV